MVHRQEQIKDSRNVDLWEEYREKIKLAKDREVSDLHSHFVDVVEKIGDFEVVPMTLEKYALLSIDSLWNSVDPLIPVLRSLWILSPDYSNSPSQAKEFISKNKRIKANEYTNEIRQFINQSFDLAPKNSNKEDTDASEWISSFVDTFASEYGWSDKTILTTPLPKLFLYLRRIQQRNTGEKIKFNSEADRLQNEFMEEMNQRN